MPNLNLAQTAQTATEAIAAKAATVATYGGGSVAAIGGYTSNEIIGFGGLLIGLVGLVANIWFKVQHLRIAQEKRQADMEQ